MSSTYTDSALWDKIAAFAKAAGTEVVEKALWLYYAARLPETPAGAKAVIFGALAYFIFPIDAVPDILPFVGYGDDLGVLVAAVATTAAYINTEVKEQAAQKLRGWFGA